MPTQDMGVHLFGEDALAVATIWAEARSEHRTGQVAVAEVIRNRTKRGYASDGTIAGTVLRRKQFSCFNEDTEWRPLIFGLTWGHPEVEEARAAWEIATLGSSVAHGAVLYHTVDVMPSWARAKGVTRVATIGRHMFYTDSGGAR